ncbi:glutathione S-transferase alpha-4 [Strongylocentrotus purpuratus]|uniref:Glutathione transferase n=1 Tax=Strongylocentrotus purpuratus TaxID=7668 RepID=A0A7M7NAC3_STRPU|nr:glutathione S-transferase alpha-4 [Strongylocentrotus purpuratus]
MAGDTVRLTYTASRGLGEPIRLALVASGIDYTEIYLQTREDFVKLTEGGKLMFKQIPLLEIDGLNLIGSEAVLRYVCRKGNLEGKTDEEKVKIDMLAMGAKDMVLNTIMYSRFHELLISKEKAEEDIETAIKECRNRYLPVFEKVLSESKSGFFVGDSMTMADIMLFDALSCVNEIPELKAIGLLDEYPLCVAFIDHFSKQPRIVDYLASERRHTVIDLEQAAYASRLFGWLPS